MAEKDDYLIGINKKSKKEQIEIMKKWFYSKFEDPAEYLPYESREGGYQYYKGTGPFIAEDVLREEFEGKVYEAAIKDLVDELGEEGSEWALKHNLFLELK